MKNYINVIVVSMVASIMPCACAITPRVSTWESSKPFTVVMPAKPAELIMGNQALVSKNEAEFTFPINPQKQYEWCPGGLEYAWMVSAHNGNDTFEFGFSLVTAMGASPCRKGNFRDLLNEGQFNIWKVKSNGASVVPDLKVEHAFNGDGQLLSIILKDKRAIELIFSKKPKHVIFQSQVLEKKLSTKVPVVYSELLTSSVLAQTLEVPFSTTCTTDIDSECYSLHEVRGLDPKGDGFLAVRVGPGSNYRMIDRLYNGDRVYVFQG